jgi:hypothetical protein
LVSDAVEAMVAGEDGDSGEDAVSDAWIGGNPTAQNLFNFIACLQGYEGVRLQVLA